MKFDKYLDLKGKHAFLSPSSSAWLRYDKEKLKQVYLSRRAAELGTRLHEFAAEAIELNRKMPQNKDTLNLYINDAIKYHMETEVPLYYSDYCFGHTDAISFDDEKQFLRIHDLKTGEHGSMEQLEVYASLFCLMKHKDPFKIGIELRLYKQGEVLVNNPSPEKIQDYMDIIVDDCDYIVSQLEEIEI